MYMEMKSKFAKWKQIKRKNDVELTTKEKNELKPDKDGYIHNPIFNDKFNYTEYANEIYDK